MSNLPEQPYRGLRYYGPEDADVFAGRDEDARLCADALYQHRVLLLHGRTGCGKSSFLRAGLKATLANRKSSIVVTPNHDQKDLLVTRSGQLPLRSLAGLIFDLTADLKSGSVNLGRILHNPHDARLGHGNREQFINHCAADHHSVMQSLEAICESVTGTPVLVIDQAEEVFTLRPGGASQRPKPLSELEPDSEAYKAAREVDEYFRFIGALGRRNLNMRLIVSLRTEYKGQFDDEIAVAGGGPGIAGFFLPDLDRDSLIAAILRPTENLETRNGKISGRSRYKFEFEAELPGKVADALLNSTPRGGVLPTLQVICQRMVTAARAASPNSIATLREADFRRLGPVETQIDQYLRETLESCAGETGGPESVSSQVHRWYRVLNRFVQVEADGRVVTQKLSEKAVEAIGETLVPGSQSDPHGLVFIKTLAADKVGILRHERDQGAKERQYSWTSLHDSIGLAVDRWNTRDGAIASARISGIRLRKPENYQLKDLFSGDDDIAKFDLIVPDTFVWSHQLPLYAKERGYFSRLGITVDVHRELTVAGGMTGYAELDSHIRKLGRPNRVLVAIERTGFPDVKRRAEWTDFAVPTLFTGYALIGPKIADVTPLNDITINKGLGKKGAQTERSIDEIGRLIDVLSQKKAGENKYKIYFYNDTAYKFFETILNLSGKSDRLGDVKLERLTGNQFSVTDELAQKMLFEPNAFVITTAVGRAVAERNGQITYVDTVHLKDLIDEWCVDDREEMINQFRASVSHIAWQIGISSATWEDDTETRDLICRLASVAYFTVEQISQNPDDFVAFICEHLATYLPVDEQRIDPEIVRRAIERSYSFVRFDDQPRLILDRSSPFGYWANDMNETVSTPAQVYSVLLKQQIQAQQTSAKMAQDLASAYQAGHAIDPRTNELKDMAWRHLEIFNFVDAERYMKRADEIATPK